MKFTLVAIALASTASAICHNSIACLTGGDEMCGKVCVRQGNPNGGRCAPRDGCPGFSICACYPKKRDDGAPAVDGEQQLWDDEVKTMIAPYVDEADLDKPEVRDNAVEAALRDIEEDSSDVQARSALTTRSTCCSLLPPFSGLCCDDHCTYIGKPGGQCQDKGHGDVCYCN
ncbi:hypothetical protein NLG97_g1950 [Lecanicillium saksenae]|uniref:Uncharacterized protein n=1 Tax=Lecanicillium saksenae TaxID=468837 RepID=A0ACC1R6E7_9HYPO|nr:hypothetical protein NLG97_g1950 [Lecanicillium saksenae]